MAFQLTEKQLWAHTLLFIVYQPMVANKTGRYPLQKIISQFQNYERVKVRQGIEALVELGIFVMQESDVCITNISEGIFQGLGDIAGRPAAEVEQELKAAPAFMGLLTAIDNDVRFAPPRSTSSTPRSGTTSSPPIPRTEPMGLGSKIFFGIFALIVVLGLMKAIFRY